MPTIPDTIVQSRAIRALVLAAVIIPLSFYLGTSTIRRGFFYYLEGAAPAVVLASAVGLWTWSWKSFATVLTTCVLMTVLVQALVYLFW